MTFRSKSYLTCKDLDSCNVCGSGKDIYISVCAEEITRLLGKLENIVCFQISLYNDVAK